MAHDSGEDASSTDSGVDSAQTPGDAAGPDASSDAGHDGGSDAAVVTCPALPTTDGLPAAMSGMLARHNRWRALVGVPALTWSATLQAHAQDWANQLASACNATHDPNSSEGENIASFSSSSPASAPTVVDLWASERVDYDYGTVLTLENFAAFGHYTQVVWSTSTSVGCAYAIGTCPSSHPQHWVCRYSPAGNYLGQAAYGHTTNACVDLDNDDVLQKDDADDHDRAVD